MQETNASVDDYREVVATWGRQLVLEGRITINDFRRAVWNGQACELRADPMEAVVAELRGGISASEQSGENDR
jgi:hypothetical protein